MNMAYCSIYFYICLNYFFLKKNLASKKFMHTYFRINFQLIFDAIVHVITSVNYIFSFSLLLLESQLTFVC